MSPLPGACKTILIMEEKFENTTEEKKTWTVTTDTVSPEKDKFWHFVGCMAITLITFFIGGSFGYAMLGVIIALMIGYLKELYDKFFKKTKFDWKDIAWDTFGAFAGLLVAAIMYIITHPQ